MTNCSQSWKPKPSSMDHFQQRQDEADGTKKLHIGYTVFCKWQYDLKSYAQYVVLHLLFMNTSMAYDAENQPFYLFTCFDFIGFYFQCKVQCSKAREEKFQFWLQCLTHTSNVLTKYIKGMSNHFYASLKLIVTALSNMGDNSYLIQKKCLVWFNPVS